MQDVLRFVHDDALIGDYDAWAQERIQYLEENMLTCLRDLRGRSVVEAEEEEEEAEKEWPPPSSPVVMMGTLPEDA